MAQTFRQKKEAAYCKRVQDAARAAHVPLGLRDWTDVRYCFSVGKPVEDAIVSVVGRACGARDSAEIRHCRVQVDSAFAVDSLERFEVGPCVPQLVVDRIRLKVTAGGLAGDELHWENRPNDRDNFYPVKYRWEFVG